MNSTLQYNLFEPKIESFDEAIQLANELRFLKVEILASLKLLKEEKEEINRKVEKVRKGLYAKHGALEKARLEDKELLNILVKNICRQ